MTERIIYCPHCGTNSGKNTIQCNEQHQEFSIYSCYNCGKDHIRDVTGDLLNLVHASHVNIGTVQTEEKIKEIYSDVDELRDLLKLPKEHAQVSVDYFGQWHVKVRTSLMTFGGKFTHLMERGHSGETLEIALNEASEGAKEELELYKKGLTRGIP